MRAAVARHAVSDSPLPVTVRTRSARNTKAADFGSAGLFEYEKPDDYLDTLR